MTKNYHAFLLRMWKNENPLGDKWLLSIEDPTSHKTTYFRTIDELSQFLRNISNKDDYQTVEKNGSDRIN